MAKVRVRYPLDHSRPLDAPVPEEPEGRVYVEGTVPSRQTPEEPEVFETVESKVLPTRTQRAKKRALDATPEKLRHPSDLAIRIRTGAIYIALTVICVLASEVTTAIYLAALCAICAYEYCTMLRADAKTPNELIGVVGAACLPLATWIWGTGGMLTILFLLMLVLLVWYVFYQPARISDVAISLFGAMYTGLMMSAAMLLRMGIDGFWGGVLLLGIFASIWGNDAFAYLVGSKFGKHKMAPTISPKKSWEGFFGGMIFSVVAWLLMTQIPGLNMTFPIAVVMGIVCGFFGVLGDLVESRIKRNSGFKDSGTIMPGHGGLLDRCDSQFLVTVVAALGLFLTGCLPYVI